MLFNSGFFSNFSLGLAAKILRGGASIATIYLLSSSLSPGAFASIALAFSSCSLIAALISFGTDNIILSKFVNSPTKSQKVVWLFRSVLIKQPIFIICLAGSLFYSSVLPSHLSRCLLLQLLSLALIPFSSVENMLISFNKHKQVAIAWIVSTSICFILKIAAIFTASNLYQISFILNLDASITIAILLWYSYKYHYLDWNITRNFFRKWFLPMSLLKESTPYLLSSLLFTGFYTAESFLSHHFLKNDAAFATHTFALKIVQQFFIFFGIVISASATSTYSKSKLGDGAPVLSFLCRKEFMLLYFLSLFPIFVGVLLNLRISPLSQLLARPYIESIFLTASFLPLLVFTTSALNLYNTLTDNHKICAVASLIAIIVLPFSQIFFVNRLQVIGPSAALLFTQVIVLGSTLSLTYFEKNRKSNSLEIN